MIRMRIIDSHVHFPTPDFFGKPEGRVHPWLAQERTRWRKAWQFDGAEPLQSKDELVERWYREAIEHDISVVFVTSGGNDAMSEIVKAHPDRFYGYAHHDPSLKEAPYLLEKAIKEQGLKGYKILGPAVNTPLDCKDLYPVWEVAQGENIPVLIHFGIMGSAGGIANHVNINPLIIHDVAKNFPDLKIIVPHFGCGYIFETLNLCWACPNVYIDTSGSNQWMRWMPYEVNLEMLFRKYRETIGPGRILFGTDSSYFPRGYAKSYFDEQFKAMVNVGYSDDEIDKVVFGNIDDLLKGR